MEIKLQITQIWQLCGLNCKQSSAANSNESTIKRGKFDILKLDVIYAPMTT